MEDDWCITRELLKKNNSDDILTMKILKKTLKEDFEKINFDNSGIVIEDVDAILKKRMPYL